MSGNFFMPPRADHIPTARRARRSLFGPVASCFHAADLDECDSNAKTSRFDWAVPGPRQARAERFINDWSLAVFIKPHGGFVPIPFGGIKLSVMGRWGLMYREFTNIRQ